AVVGAVILKRFPVADAALGPEEIAVDLDDSLAASARMQSVDVLGDEEESVAKAALQLGERRVARVGLAARRSPPPLGIKAPDESGIGAKALGRRKSLEGMVLPQATRASKSWDSALGGDAGAGEHENPRPVVDLRPNHGPHPSRCSAGRQPARIAYGRSGSITSTVARPCVA